MKRIIAVLILAATIATAGMPIKFVNSESLTGKRLAHRKGKYVVVEVIRGKCIDRKGNGRTRGGDYISYKRVRGHRKGARYTTYCVYANNNSIDDIVFRVDVSRK